jgi:hypothetical protein
MDPPPPAEMQCVAFTVAMCLVYGSLIYNDDNYASLDCLTPRDLVISIGEFVRGEKDKSDRIMSTRSSSVTAIAPVDYDSINLRVNDDLLIYGLKASVFGKVLKDWGWTRINDRDNRGSGLSFSPKHNFLGLYCLPPVQKHGSWVKYLRGIGNCIEMARSLIKDSENDMVKQVQIVCHAILAKAGYSTTTVPHTISEVDLLPRALTTPDEAMKHPTTPDADEIEEEEVPDDTTEEQLTRLIEYYIRKNWSVVGHYYHHGLPSFDKRLTAVQECCDDLYQSLMQQQASGRQKKITRQIEARASGTSRKRVKIIIKKEGEEPTTPNVTLFPDKITATSSCTDVVDVEDVVKTKVLETYRTKKECAQEQFAVRHIDELVVRRRNILTPSTVIMGLLDYFGNVTQRVLSLHCQQGITHSTTTTKYIVEGLVNQLTKKTEKELGEAVACDSTYILTIMDNYNPNRWLKFKAVDEAFTHTIATIATLLRFLPVAIEPTPVQARTPVYYLLDHNSIQAHINAGQRWITISEEHSQIIDADYTAQSVKSFSPWPSIPGKSSDHHQVQEKVLDEFLIGACGMNKKPVFVVLDTEIVAITGLKQYLDPEKYANLMLLPSPFHYRMHLIYNLVLEPVFFLLFWAPYLYEHHVVQKVKIATMVVSLINILNDIRTFQEVNKNKVGETYTAAEPASSSSSNPPSKKPKQSHKAYGTTCLNKEDEEEALSKIHLLMLDVLAECADATDNTGLGEDSDSDTEDEDDGRARATRSTKKAKGTGKKVLYDNARYK